METARAFRFVKILGAGVFATLSLILFLNVLIALPHAIGSPYALGQLAGSGFAIALGIALSTALFKNARGGKKR